MMRGEAANALRVFDEALEMQPQLEEARFNRAIALLKLGRHEEASREFEQMAAATSSAYRAAASYHAALALDRLGKAGDAEKALERALGLDPLFDAALLYLGVLRERRGDHAAAAKAYLAFLKRNPQSIVAMLRLGTAASRAGRLDVARTYLGQVVAAAPRSPEAVEARKLLVMWE